MSVSCLRYTVYGRVLESELELPGLPRAEDGAPVEVRLRCARTPRKLAQPVNEGACFQAAPGEFLIWREGVARFFVQGGDRIEVEAEDAVAPEQIAALLFSAPWAALALQAGELPLHASAVATGQGAAVLLGRAALGKSALALACQRRGAALLADDLAVLRVDDAGAAIAAGPPRVTLWPDMWQAFGLAEDASRPVENARRALAVPHPGADARRVAALYVLERTAGDAGENSVALSGAEAIWALLDAVYRPAFMRGMHCERTVLAQVTALARRLPVRRLALPAGSTVPAQAAERIEQEVGA